MEVRTATCGSAQHRLFSHLVIVDIEPRMFHASRWQSRANRPYPMPKPYARCIVAIATGTWTAVVRLARRAVPTAARTRHAP